MPITASLPNGLRESVERELAPDERVVWMDMPAARFFTPKSIATVIFAIPWTGFNLAFMYSVRQIDASEAPGWFHTFDIFGLPFTLIGVFLLLAPLWSYLMARKTAYVITDKRAISFEYGWGRMTVRNFTPEKLKNVFRRERGNGTGDVIVAFDEWTDMDGDRHREDLGFKDIRDTKYVEDLLRELSSRAPVTAS